MSRIIAGSHGGRRLTMPAGDGTRPTTDRVREALFSAIASWAGTADGPADAALAGLAFLDLYAGSGAVGLEAASRGAGPVLLVEGHRRTAALTAANAKALGLAAEVRAVRVEQLVAGPAPHPFDVVFCDPPYDLASGELSTVLVGLAAHGWLAPDGLLVVERSRRSADLSWPDAGEDTARRAYGETLLHLGYAAPAPVTTPSTGPETTVHPGSPE